MCIVSSIINSIEFRQSTSQQYFNFGTDGNTSAYSGFLTFWYEQVVMLAFTSYRFLIRLMFDRVTLILYQNIIPISLYISVEIVKTLAVSVGSLLHKLSLSLSRGTIY
jgi:phospholipid-translocating ATPase